MDSPDQRLTLTRKFMFNVSGCLTPFLSRSRSTSNDHDIDPTVRGDPE
jgi:hypothetical protein